MLARLVLSLAGIGLLAAPTVVSPQPQLLWNVTPSMPVGLYWLDHRRPSRRNAIVAIRVPDRFAGLFAARGYLPPGVPLLKRIAALPGQTVCRRGLMITVDGRAMATALTHDRLGRPLPRWHGCRTLRREEMFVLSRTVRDSLDSRYFGVLPGAALVGVATPLWTQAVR